MSRLSLLSITVAAAAALTASHTLGTDALPKVARVGIVHAVSPSLNVDALTAFFNRLRELGWVEGRNLTVEARSAEGHNERLPALMTEVIERKVDVLMTYGTPPAVAAKRATTTIPIVVALMGDPVETGLANSLAHPGGNLTGLSTGFGEGFSGKWLEILRETVPRLSSLAVISNSDSSLTKRLRREIETIAPTQHIKPRFIEVNQAGSFEGALRQAQQGAQAFLVLPDPVTYQHREEIAALALRYHLPGMYPNVEFVDVGGLMAYGFDTVALFRRAAEYVDKILRGAKAAELPIEQPTKYKLAINLKTAKALGLIFPESILLRADEAIR